MAKSGRLDTIILGLGGQGTKHAGLMHDFGTSIVAGVAPGGAGTRVHEVIPVFDSVKDCLAEFPDVVAASVWRHYSTAREAALEAIEAGIPLVVLISEGLAPEGRPGHHRLRPGSTIPSSSVGTRRD